MAPVPPGAFGLAGIQDVLQFREVLGKGGSQGVVLRGGHQVRSRGDEVDEDLPRWTGFGMTGDLDDRLINPAAFPNAGEAFPDPGSGGLIQIERGSGEGDFHDGRGLSGECRRLGTTVCRRISRFGK